MIKQKTLKKEIAFSGLGLFQNSLSHIKLVPAGVNTGIVFVRTDLDVPLEMPAQLEFLDSSPRCTKITKEGISVQTVEHLLAAVAANGVDNLRIETSGEEVPIFDGSSFHFVECIKKAEVVEQEAEKTVWMLQEPVVWSQNDTYLLALPAPEYRISYMLHYPQSTYLRSQYYSFRVTPEGFFHEIAPCRTFALYEEIEPLIATGVLRGGGLENGVVIKGEEVLNPEGVRFSDEMVRHKVLDVIGDLSLMGISFNAHIIAVKTGHAANHAFARQLKKSLQRFT